MAIVVACMHTPQLACTTTDLTSSVHTLKKHDQQYKVSKHFQKMLMDVGIAVPKTTESRCRDGSGHPFFIPEIILRVMLQDYWEKQF